MSSFSVQAFQEKINRLTLSQDSIETLSLWVIHHRGFAKSCVALWLDGMQKAKPDRRLILFYLANDILQNGRRRGADVFFDLFREPLKSAVTLTAGSKIQSSIERMFRIWKERRIYDNAFLRELQQLIEPSRKEQEVEQVSEFKISLLADALTELRKFEAELKVKSSHLSSLRVDISNPTASLALLKEKSAGGQFSTEFEDASQKLQDYCECLGIEVNERINVLEMLRECQTSQTRRLANYQQTTDDYARLEKMIDSLKSKLDVRLKELERAQHTSTSDPTAREDITEEGDMEIESDNDSQESAMEPSTAAPPPLSQSAHDQLLQQQQQQPLRSTPNPQAPQIVAAPPANSRPPEGFGSARTPLYQHLPPPPPIFQAPPPPQGVSYSQQVPMRGFTSQPVPPAAPPMPPPRPIPAALPLPPPAQQPSGISATPTPLNHNTTGSYYPNTPMNSQGPSSSLLFPPPNAQTPPPVFNSSSSALPSAAPPTHSGFTPPPPLSSAQALTYSTTSSGANNTAIHPSFPSHFTSHQPALTASASSVQYPTHVQPSSAAAPPPLSSSSSSSFGYMQGTSSAPLSSDASAVTSSLAGIHVTQPTTGAESPHFSEDDLTNNDSSHSLDERLQTLVSQKMLDRVIDYPDDAPDIVDRPYSPSSAERDIMSGAASPMEKEETDSLPTPNTENATPEASPQVNMSNPILKALYQSSPEEATFTSFSSTSPTFPSDPHLESSSFEAAKPQHPASVTSPLLANLDTGFLHSILQSVKAASSEPQKQSAALRSPPPPVTAIATCASSVSPPLQEAPPRLQPKSAVIPNFDHVKITPALTSALDQILPQLSKSLTNERKRQAPLADSSPLQSPTKVPRLDTTGSVNTNLSSPSPTAHHFTSMESDQFAPRGNSPGPRGNPQGPPRPNFMPRGRGGGPVARGGGFVRPPRPRMPLRNDARPLNQPPQFRRGPGMICPPPRHPSPHRPPSPSRVAPPVNRFGPPRPPQPPRGYPNRGPYRPRPPQNHRYPPPPRPQQRAEFFRQSSPKPYSRTFPGEPPAQFRPRFM